MSAVTALLILPAHDMAPDELPGVFTGLVSLRRDDKRKGRIYKASDSHLHFNLPTSRMISYWLLVSEVASEDDSELVLTRAWSCLVILYCVTKWMDFDFRWRLDKWNSNEMKAKNTENQD